ncbi:MAG TPA: hypothetical protein VGO47_03100 [Chlamydiales bacterium]|nr:hypothetical protein [Chlamydiales bacterium]
MQETCDDHQGGKGIVLSSPNPSYALKQVDMPPVEYPGNPLTNEGEAVISVPEAEAGARVGRQGRKRQVKGGGVDESVQLEARKKLRKRG